MINDYSREVWTLAQLCSYLQLNEQTLVTLIRQGLIPYIRLGRQYRFYISDLKRVGLYRE